MRYLCHLSIYFSIYAIAVSGLNLITGYCGLFSLAHAAFFSIGAYEYPFATRDLHLDFPLAFLLATAAGVVLSPVLSIPTWRGGGDFFVLVSLAVQMLALSVFQNFAALGGMMGLAAVPGPSFGPWNLRSEYAIALAYALFAASALWMISVLTTSPWARLLSCLREDELAVRSL